MIYKSFTATIFALALATSAFAQTGTGTTVDPGATKPTGTSEGAMPDSKPADDTNKTPRKENAPDTMKSDKSGAMGETDSMSSDAPKSNSPAVDKNCPDKNAIDSNGSNTTAPPTKPEDCP